MNDTAPISTHSELHRILSRSLEKLAAHEGLTILEVAARCVLSSQTPTYPAYSREVVTAHQRLENELTCGAKLEVNA